MVALNPATGAILAMASYPSYDPNELASHNGTQVNNYDNALLRQTPEPAAEQRDPDHTAARLDVQDRHQLRVVHPGRHPEPEQHGLLPAAAHAAADDRQAAQRQRGAVRLGRRTGQTTILCAFAQSCNTPFANLGMELGGATIKSTADQYGLNNPAT